MDRNYTIVPLSSTPGILDELTSRPPYSMIEEHPQIGRYGRAYYPVYWGENYRDFSYAVMWRGQPALIVLCGLNGVTLGLHGLPSHIFYPPDMDRHVLTLAVKTAFTRLDEIAVAEGVQEIAIREIASSVLSPVGECALGREAKAQTTLTGMVDLEAGPAVWKHALRKSFHQFVNWGRKNYAIEYVNKDNQDRALFDAYRAFHAQVAGRVTRPKESWDVQFDEICHGRGELILGKLDGALAAGSLFIDGTAVTIYMNGVYARDMGKPLAHYMIWHGIERAHQRGLRSFQLGDIHLPDAVDDKRHSIGYFKRGFATHFDANFVWTWSPTGVAS